MSFYNKETVYVGPPDGGNWSPDGFGIYNMLICFRFQIYNISICLKARRSDFFDEFLKFEFMVQ